MKFIRTILIIVFIVIYVNTKVLAKKSKHKNNNKSNGTYISHRDKNHVEEKSLKIRQNGKQSKLKLSAQLAKAKEICWSGQYISKRIINGTKASKDTLPWMVAIFKIVDKTSRFSCGGAIVSTKFVLSAAMCFRAEIPKPTDYTVRYGMHDLRSKNSVKGTIAKIYKHPKPDIGHNNIALVLLKHEVKYNDVVQPICIPGLTTPSFWDKWATGDPVLISGWGRVNDSWNVIGEWWPKVLRKGHARLTNYSYCKKHLPEWYQFDPRTSLCAGGKGSESTACHGDDGSPVIPLVCLKGKESFVFPVVIGLFAVGGINCTGYPVVLTKVESFIDWINKIISKLS